MIAINKYWMIILTCTCDLWSAIFTHVKLAP
jgi:hypothetical protein